MRYGGDTKDVLQRARAAGVSRMAVIGTRAADSEAAVQLSENEEGVFCAVGIHPNDVDDVDEKEWGRIEKLVGSGKVSAIGETGLDWFRTVASKENQQLFFDRHIDLSQATELPLVIHTRNSIRDVLDTLAKATQHKPMTGVLHAFSGTSEEAAEALELGFYIGFAGMVTFRSAESLREVAQTVPLDRLLVETDSPFLSPEPLRGRRNEPSHVVHTARCLANIRGETIESLAAATTENACLLFRANGSE
ncbi:MAG TPA: hydrolase TatD [Planctomycetaceae bacterium]|nr:hydrolase TatD [Planctomycetaceae bacterium]